MHTDTCLCNQHYCFGSWLLNFHNFFIIYRNYWCLIHCIVKISNQCFPFVREKLQEVKGKKASELDKLEKQTLKLKTEMKDKIKANVEEVEREVQHCQLLVSCLSVVRCVSNRFFLTIQVLIYFKGFQCHE